jgi:NAD-dependent SIR2 family protein deacetylase
MSTVDIPDLARAISRSDDVVFLTGAGLSVASGLAPYRKSKDAVWSRFIMEWGTIEKFHDDPAQWWREFWIKAHGDLGKVDVKPNAGHDAITQIVKANPEHLVITQNIDGLHRASGVPEEQLVEIHGRYDRFVCTSSSCEGVLNAVPSVDLSILDRGDIPRCAKCNAPLRPNVLLFDEMYDSHPTYNMRKARKHLNDAEVIIFVGTSFSVGITDYAVRAGEYAKARLVNVNVEPIEDYRFENILGPSEETLPKLAAEVARPPLSVTS